MSEAIPEMKSKEVDEKPFDPNEIIKPIAALGDYLYNPAEDEVYGAEIEYNNIKKLILAALDEFRAEEEKVNKPSGYIMSDKFRDAKSYLEGRLHAVNWVLEQINPNLKP